VPVGVVAGLAETGAAFFRVAGFFGLVTVFRSAVRRLRRAFFFACALRRFIFIELRLSCFPTARKMHSARRTRQAAHHGSRT
jgi:hypothetical protein